MFYFYILSYEAILPNKLASLSCINQCLAMDIGGIVRTCLRYAVIVGSDISKLPGDGK